ncbi:unnamed protein product [Parajaminaea phylloscopi]
MSHLPDSGAYASAAGAGSNDSYRNRASGGHDQNEFRTPYSPAQDGGFSTAPHWQAQSYGGYPTAGQNQFAATNGSSHPSYSGAPYGATHASPYSAFSMPSHHSRTGHLQGYGHHPESGPPTPNSASMSQHNTPGGLGASPAYHSPSMAGMVPGLAHVHSAAAAHQSYPSHYQASLVPQSGPGSVAGGLGAPHLGSAGAVSSPGYPSAPQYSTQLPMAGRHRVTTTLWEDEGTLCFQVDAKGVCVARRHDNNMINGTKLLNVCGMSRGKRDGILKNEKERIVVKVGAMHLKGVWITFTRGKQLAEQNGIAELLYPLFEPNIQSFLYHPENYPRTAAVMAAAQERQNKRGPETASPSTAQVGGGHHDQADYSASWSRHPSGSAYANLSAPTTATQSPNHAAHPHSGYSTPSMQQQPSASSTNGTAAGGARPLPVDRRHSMPMNNNGNPADHPGRAENPYAAMGALDHGGNHAAATLAGVGPGAQARRTASGTKRVFDDGPDSDPYASAGLPGTGAGDRTYKRIRDGRGDDFGADAYDNGALDAQHAYGNGRNDRSAGKA